MKIISKHKDYYDYLQGIYGIDEVMVYDRRVDRPYRFEDIIITDHNEITTIRFAICNKIFVLFYYDGKFYHTPEERLELHNLKYKSNNIPTWQRSYRYGYSHDIKSAEYQYNKENCNTDVNRILRQPVLVKVDYCGEFTTIIHGGKEHWNLPILDTFKLAKYITADKMYQDISAFIGWTKDHPEIPNNQSNDEKIISHGFDLKDSFRPNKKN